jgi:hypothetical protein
MKKKTNDFPVSRNLKEFPAGKKGPGRAAAAAGMKNRVFCDLFISVIS